MKRLLYVIPLVAALVLGASNAANGQGEQDNATYGRPAPAVLAPPAGNSLSSVFRAHGVQVYQCTAGAWTFLEPAASLTGHSVKPLSYARLSVLHFRGPSWESADDGSLVTATAVANSPVPGSIAELLLKAASNRGTGIFGRVTYVQRLSTTGGAMPTGACTDGATKGVPYTAEYRFFVAS
jgi:hypothetical protein